MKSDVKHNLLFTLKVSGKSLFVVQKNKEDLRHTLYYEDLKATVTKS